MRTGAVKKEDWTTVVRTRLVRTGKETSAVRRETVRVWTREGAAMRT